jgi:peptidase S24-like protein
MIPIIDIVRVRGSLTISDLGPVHDLLTRGSLVSFKVASWSMFPTMHKGDLIEIEPAASLQVGDVVVFRSGDALLCHRVTGVLSTQEILTRGDASTEPDDPVRREDLMGKVTAIIRRGQRRNPRLIPAPTLLSMLQLYGDLFVGRLQAWIVAVGLGLWQRLKRRSMTQRLSAYLLRKSVKFSVGVRASNWLMHAYQCYALSGFPVKDEILERIPPDFKRSEDLILLAHLGPYRLGTFQLASGELKIRQPVTGLGLEDWLLDLGARIRHWHEMQKGLTRHDGATRELRPGKPDVSSLHRRI